MRTSMLFLLVALVGCARVSGPSEEEIQSKHQEYAKLASEREGLRKDMATARSLQYSPAVAEDPIKSEKVAATLAKAESADKQLTGRMLDLERQYAKLWTERGYKTHP